VSYADQVKYIQELAQDIKSQGFIVYIANTGNYGFFTDTEGKHVVSFGFRGHFELKFSGNYQALKSGDAEHVGTGWGLPEGLTFNEMINSTPPQWATKGLCVRKITLSEHLARYQLSSKYSAF
jgi:hypothetical protein